MKKKRIIAMLLGTALLVCGCQQTSKATDEEKKIESEKNTTKTEENAYQGKLDLITPAAYNNTDGLKLKKGDYISIIGKANGTQYWDEVKKGVAQAAEDINTNLGYTGKDKVKVAFNAPDTADNVDDQVNLLDEELDMDELSNMQKTVSDEINAGTYRPKDSELPEGQLTGEDVVTADSITEDQVVDYILAKHPNITGCFAANGDSVKLAVDGLERNKMEKKVKVIGFDANDDEIQDLKDGKVNGLIVQNPFGMGYATVVAAARASLNMGNEAVVNTGYTWVTKKNLKTDEVQKILYSK